MSTQVDSRVVEMRFDNAQFESAVAQTMSTLQKLERSLQLDGAGKGLDGLQTNLDTVSFSHMQRSIDQIAGHFTVWGTAVNTVITNIVSNVQSKVRGIINSLTVEPVSDGWTEYELKMGSVQTIMASTGESLDVVNRYLSELNTYSDKTIYSFSDMTNSIGKFTNAGVDLDTAVKAIQGISNEAAVSGANAQEASRAMYNFAQALSAGSVKLIDWKSIENANMATEEFKTKLLETAVAVGTVSKDTEGMYHTIKSNGKLSDAITATQGFNDSLKDEWMTTEVLTKTLAEYADETTEIGKKAYAAAQDVKTYGQLMDTLKEAVGSGWSETFEIIFGDFEQAKELWTSISNVVGGFIDKMSSARNDLLRSALGVKDISGSFGEMFKSSSFLGGLIKDLKEAGIETENYSHANHRLEDALKALARNSGVDIDSMIKESGSLFDTFKNGWFSVDLINDALKDLDGSTEATGASMEELEGIAKRVIQGEFGNGQTRIDKLTEAGYNYANVQSMVNHILLGTEVNLEGLSDAQLKQKGYTEEQIAVLRALQKQAQETGTPLHELLEEMSRPTGRQLLIESIANIFKGLGNIIGGVKDGISGLMGQITGEDLYQGITVFHAASEEFLTISEVLRGPIAGGVGVIAKTIRLVIDTIKAGLGYIMPILASLGVKALNVAVTLIEDVGVALTYVVAAIEYFGEIFSSSFLRPLLDYLQQVAYYVVGSLYLGFFKLRTAVLRAKKALEPVVSSLKAFVKASEPIVRSKLTTAFTRIKKICSDLRVIFGATVAKLGNFGKISESVAAMIRPLYDRIEGIIHSGGSFDDKVKAIKETLFGFGKAVLDTIVQNTVLKDIIASVSEKFETFKETVKKFTGIDVGAAIDGIKTAVGNLIDKAKELPIVNDFFGTINKALEDMKNKGLFDWAIEQFDKLKEKIKSIFGSNENDIKVIGDGSLIDKIKGFFAPLKAFTDPEGVDGGEPFTLQTVIKKILEGLSEALSKIDPKIVAGIGVLAGIVFAIYKIFTFIAGIIGIVGNAGKVVKNTANVLDSLNTAIKTYNQGQKANAFYTVAKGVLAIAAGLYLLTTVDTGKLGAATFAMAVVLGLIIVILNTINKLKKPTVEADTAIKEKLRSFLENVGEAFGELAKAAKYFIFMVGFAVAVSILAGAIMALAGIPFLAAIKGIVLAGVLAAGMTHFAKEMQKAEGSLSVGDALSFIAMAVAVKILTGAISELANLASSGKGFWSAVIVVGLLSAALTAITIAISKWANDSTDMIKAGVFLLIFAMSIKKLVGAIKTLGKMDLGQLIQGGIALAAIMAVFTIMVTKLSSSVKDIDQITKLLKTFSSTILILAVALGALTILSSFGDLMGTVLAISLVIGVFTGALFVLSNYAPGMAILGESLKKMGEGLKAAAIGVAIFVAAIVAFFVLLPKIFEGIGGAISFIMAHGPQIVAALKALGLMIWHGILNMATFLVEWLVATVSSIITSVIEFFKGISPSAIMNFLATAWSIISSIGAGIFQFLASWVPEFFAGVGKAIGDGVNWLRLACIELFANMAKDLADKLPLGLGKGISDWADGVINDVKNEQQKLSKEMDGFKEGPSDDEIEKAYDKSEPIKTGSNNTIVAAKESIQEVKDTMSEGYGDIATDNNEQYQKIFDLTGIVDETTSGNILSIDGSKEQMSAAMSSYLPDITGSMGDFDIEGMMSGNFDISQIMDSITEDNVTSITSGTDQVVGAQNSFFDTIKSNASGKSDELYDSYSEDGSMSVKGYTDGFEAGKGTITKTVTTAFTDVIAAGRNVLGIASPSRAFIEMGKRSGEGYSVGLKVSGPTIKKQIVDALNMALKAVAPQNSKWTNAGKTMGNNFAKGLNNAKRSAQSAGKSLSGMAYSGLKAHSSNDFERLGKDAGEGYARGIRTKWHDAWQAAYTLGLKAKQGTAAAQRSASPSKEFALLGNYAGEGYAIGMGQMSKVVETAATSMADDAIRGMQEAVEYIRDIIDGSLDYDPTIRPVLDLSSVEEGIERANGMLNVSTPFTVNPSGIRKDSMNELADLLRVNVSNRRLAAAGAGGNTYNITVNAPTGNARDIAREIEKIIVRR